jgi:tRNA threonylcarbamoyladenosine biosynthesis protein TsaE
MKSVEIKNLADLENWAIHFYQTFGKQRVWCFDAQMGAGKTTFLQAVAKHLQVKETVQSPTFAICNVYNSDSVGEIYHYDFYRIKNIHEAMDMGFLEQLDSGHYCWIEWATAVEKLLPPDALHIKIEVQENGTRIFTIKNYTTT